MQATHAHILGIAHGVSCHSAPEVKKAAYKQIWREIDSLEASIHALKSRHNSLNITARLPQEILSQIFDWTATMLRNESSRWIRISFVCSHWRRVALECPRLWRRVSCTSPERLRTLLPRTGVVPLEVYFSFVNKSSAVGISQVLSQEMLRVRELKLGSYKRGTWQRTRMELVVPHLTQPAPLLETFSVVSESSIRRESSHLPDNLFAGDAPRLRTLEIVNCIMPKSLPLLTGITSLKLRDTNQVPHGLSLDELILMLESLLNIQVLELHDAHYSRSAGLNGSAPPGRTVHLPYLRHLDIAYHPLACVALLSCLKYPITTTQNIKTIHRKHLEFLRNLGVILATRTRPIACVQVYKASKKASTLFGSERFVFKGWTRAGTRLQPPADVPHINIELLSPGQSFLTPLRAMWQALPMAGLESLGIIGNRFSKDSWLGDFGTLSSLKTIRVEDVDLGFLGALEHGLPVGLENADALPFSQKAAEPGRLSFRSLRTLVLTGHFLDSSGKMGIRQAIELKRSFRERRKRGAPLRELYISKSLLKYGELAETFRTVVKKVYRGSIEPKDDLAIRDGRCSSEGEDTEDFSIQYDYDTAGDDSEDDSSMES